MLVQYNESDAHNFTVNLEMGSIPRTLFGKMSREPQFTFYNTVILNFTMSTKYLYTKIVTLTLHLRKQLQSLVNMQQ